jgi:hypothetical protein
MNRRTQTGTCIAVTATLLLPRRFAPASRWPRIPRHVAPWQAAATFGVTCPIRGFRPGHPRRSELLPGVGSSFVPHTAVWRSPGPPAPPGA